MIKMHLRSIRGIVAAVAVMCMFMLSGRLSLAQVYEPDAPPTASISGDKLITGNKTGRNITLTLTADPYDQDLNCDTGNMEFDTFALGGNFEWVVPSGLYDTGNGPASLSGLSVTFKTKNGLTSGDVKFKLWDDGTYAQDFGGLTEVASITITIVDPDGFKKVAVNVTEAHDAAVPFTQVQVGSTTKWQLTLGGVNLPWSGRIQLGESGENKVKNSAAPAGVASGAGATTWNWQVTSDQSGQYEHGDVFGFWSTDAVFGAPLPPAAGKFHVRVISRHFRNVEAANAEFGAATDTHWWIDNTPTGNRSVP